MFNFQRMKLSSFNMNLIFNANPKRWMGKRRVKLKRKSVKDQRRKKKAQLCLFVREKK